MWRAAHSLVSEYIALFEDHIQCRLERNSTGEINIRLGQLANHVAISEGEG
jgi:hypothetical protein